MENDLRSNRESKIKNRKSMIPSRFPFLAYNLALMAGLPVLLPYYGFRAIRHGKYLPGLKERLGYLPESLKGDSSSFPLTIWIHAVSVGEVLAARPLALALREVYPTARFLISTTTETGQQRAREQLAWMNGHFYFPLDMPGAVRSTLDHIRPSLVIILETEIWPNFLRACAKRNIPVVLVNGRLSDRSFRRYALIRNGMRDLLSHFRLLLMQSDMDAERIRGLGAPPEQVKMIGNLKYDPPGKAELARQDQVAASLDAQFGLSSGPPLLVAGSTVDGEEELLLSVFQRLRAQAGFETTRFLIAPRHPERFNPVADLIKRSEFPLVRRSIPDSSASKAPLILLDTIGELAAVYRFAQVVFVGGSLVPRGGHNILEPASASRPVVTGPYTENFRDIMETFRRAHAVRQLQRFSKDELINELTSVLTELFLDSEKNQHLGRLARATFETQSGATARAVAEIQALLQAE